MHVCMYICVDGWSDCMHTRKNSCANNFLNVEICILSCDPTSSAIIAQSYDVPLVMHLQQTNFIVAN